MPGNGPKGGWDWGLSLGPGHAASCPTECADMAPLGWQFGFKLYPSPPVGTKLVFLFRKTGTLTCNDAVFLQWLLPADLERCVQNLCETQMSHSSRF